MPIFIKDFNNMQMQTGSPARTLSPMSDASMLVAKNTNEMEELRPPSRPQSRFNAKG
jgi:hypothetical protein